ncbi:hypothetical protein M514_14811 [Trichuris suis]|uniref:Uncharacterized protein n=1 Tax=Trichuris suis TaxID=68888 RepID=A0A085NTW1_9BILA|nr:hypothetical protein M514_14811 [Trichuris suis]
MRSKERRKGAETERTMEIVSVNLFFHIRSCRPALLARKEIDLKGAVHRILPVLRTTAAQRLDEQMLPYVWGPRCAPLLLQLPVAPPHCRLASSTRSRRSLRRSSAEILAQQNRRSATYQKGALNRVARKGGREKKRNTLLSAAVNRPGGQSSERPIVLHPCLCLFLGSRLPRPLRWAEIFMQHLEDKTAILAPAFRFGMQYDLSSRATTFDIAHPSVVPISSSQNDNRSKTLD